jgi:hypothetical protein
LSMYKKVHIRLYLLLQKRTISLKAANKNSNKMSLISGMFKKGYNMPCDLRDITTKLSINVLLQLSCGIFRVTMTPNGDAKHVH